MKTSPNSEIRVRFMGKTDRRSKEYYFAYTSIPANVNLADAAMFFFPDEDEETGKFGGDLVIKLKDHDPRPLPEPDPDADVENETE